MTITTEQILAVVGGSIAVVTAIFHCALYIGKLTTRIDRHEDRLNDHDDRLDRLMGHPR